MRIQPSLVNAVVPAAAWAALILASSARAGQPKPGPLRVFILAGQSNMVGQANVSTIDFLGEDPDKNRAALLKKFKPDGQTLVTRDDVWVANGGVYGNLGPGYSGRKIFLFFRGRDRGRDGEKAAEQVHGREHQCDDGSCCGHGLNKRVDSRIGFSSSATTAMLAYEFPQAMSTSARCCVPAPLRKPATAWAWGALIRNSPRP